MENKADYKYFLRCCHDYKNNKNRLLSISKSIKGESRITCVKNSDLDYVLQDLLKEQIGIVEETFKKIKEVDPVLSKIMYLNLIEKKTFEEIGSNRLVEVSERTASRKYAKKHWKEIYNKIILS